jgi:hypothetical protein
MGTARMMRRLANARHLGFVVDVTVGAGLVFFLI